MKVLTLGLTLVSFMSFTAPASAATFSFSYQGFLEQETGQNIFNSAASVNGTFVGKDLDSDGYVTQTELSQFTFTTTGFSNKPFNFSVDWNRADNVIEPATGTFAQPVRQFQYDVANSIITRLGFGGGFLYLDRNLSYENNILSVSGNAGGGPPATALVEGGLSATAVPEPTGVLGLVTAGIAAASARLKLLRNQS